MFQVYYTIGEKKISEIFATKAEAQTRNKALHEAGILAGVRMDPDESTRRREMNYPQIEGVVVSWDNFLRGRKSPLLVHGSDGDGWPATALCEWESRLCREAMSVAGIDPEKHWINGFYQRLAEVLEKNRHYITGGECDAMEDYDA